MQKRKFLYISIAVLFIIISLALLNFQVLQSKKTQAIPTPSNQKQKVDGQLMIKVKENVTEEQLTLVLQRYNAKILDRIPEIRTFSIEVPIGQEDAIMQQLLKEQLIEKANPNYIRHILFTPNDPLLSNQWHITKVEAPAAWDVARGAGIKVGIVDTGINLNHPDLAGKMVAQKVFATSTIEDKNGHGTHMAGTITAGTNNGKGVAGVCPDCKLVIAKAMNDDGSGDDFKVIQAMLWVSDQGVKVINVSVGGPQQNGSYDDAIRAIGNKGVIVVAAAGNSNTSQKFYPAGSPGVVSVAATDGNDKRSSFSNYGSWVQIAAPGDNIFSTLPTHSYVLQGAVNTKLNYDAVSGTSMAAPIVSGVAALIWSTPYGTSADAVIKRLCDTSDRITGTGSTWRCGRVNALKAISGTQSTPQPTARPTARPTTRPTTRPTARPTVRPTARPTARPTVRPTTRPTTPPVLRPTLIVIPSAACLGACPTIPFNDDIEPTAAGPQTKLAVEIFLHGIGNSGDNSNPTEYSLSNKNPLTPVRKVTVSIFDDNNSLLTNAEGEVIYNAQSGSFKGLAVPESSLPSGIYRMRIKSPQHLSGLTASIQAFTAGETNTLPSLHLVAGDINDDDKLNILDYNLILVRNVAADLNDDGAIDVKDFNLFNREISLLKGD